MSLDLTEVIIGLFGLVATLAGILWGGKRLSDGVKKETKQDLRSHADSIQLQMQQQQAEYAQSQAKEIQRMDDLLKGVRREHLECEASLQEERVARLHLESRVDALESSAP